MKKIFLYLLILAGICLLTYGAGRYFKQDHATDYGPFFYAWYGFVSSIGIVLIAKIIGLFIKRNETYYEEK